MLTSPRTQSEQERYDNTDRLISAAYNGLLWEVQEYIPVSNVNGFDSKALRVAIENGHTDCARELLPHTNPTWVSRFSLRAACLQPNTEMVEMLIPHNDKRAVIVCMVWALGNNQEMAEMLWGHVEHPDLEEYMSQVLVGSKDEWNAYERIRALQVKATIESALPSDHHPAPQRKM